MARPVRLHDVGVETEAIIDTVLEGLQKPVKELPSKFFYDERGSKLFDEITRLDEYYPTRVETAIMKAHVGAMAERIGPNAMLIEFGSGSSEKSKILLDNLPQLTAYVPVDISKEHLLQSARRIADRYPTIEVLPVWADYNDDFELPEASRRVDNRVVFFPGSTIGNFHRDEAVTFLARVARIEGDGGGMLIGVDLQKSAAVIERAYNDARGVTAEFNLNMLRRLNNEIGADFDLSRWRHRAIYNTRIGRVEMYLVSACRQAVHIGGERIEFEADEAVWTESSYKYTLKSFAEMAREAGLEVERVWKDDDDYFSIQYLVVRGS